ncbi:MAG: hypothetical protein FJ096_04170 [Deltaproteobacteria bacterium]|nr:hypothetical protein [Deltaproteobacteria bacterium]
MTAHRPSKPSVSNATLLATLLTATTGCAVGVTCEETPGCAFLGSDQDANASDPNATSEPASTSTGSGGYGPLPIGASSSTAGVTASSSVTSSSASGSTTGTGGNAPSPVPPPECQASMTPCASECVNLDGDVQHCGACGQACADGQQCTLGACAVPATLHFAGDDSATVYLDGVKVAVNPSWFVATKVDVLLTVGPHVLAIQGKNLVDPLYGSNPAAMIAELSYGGVRLATDGFWPSATSFNGGWMMPNGSLLNPQFATPYGDVVAKLWWNRDPATFAAKNFPSDSKAQWIWSSGWKTDGSVYFRKEFNVD